MVDLWPDHISACCAAEQLRYEQRRYGCFNLAGEAARNRKMTAGGAVGTQLMGTRGLGPCSRMLQTTSTPDWGQGCANGFYDHDRGYIVYKHITAGLSFVERKGRVSEVERLNA